MPGINSLAVQQPHEQLASKIIGWRAQCHADDDRAPGHAERALPFAGQLLALLTQPASGSHLLEHRASITALRELGLVAAERGSDIDDDAANFQLMAPSSRARLCIEPC